MCHEGFTKEEIMKEPNRKLFCDSEVQRLTRKSRSTIFRMRKKGQLDYHQVGDRTIAYEFKHFRHLIPMNGGSNLTA